MKTSDNGRHFIELWEGLYLRTYNDGVGVPTIGYGHTTAAGPPRVRYGMTISKEEADRILASDLAAVEANVEHHVHVPLDQSQFDALVSFDFNTGHLDRSNILLALNNGHYDIERLLMMWDHGGGRVLPGLAHRRHAEWTLFTTGKAVGP